MSKKAGKEKHPLFNSWSHFRRNLNLSQEWGTDFYLFVSEVGFRPEGHRLQKLKNTEVLSKSNFKWSPIRLKLEGFKSRNAYMQEYRKQNPELFKNIELKKRFGISLVEYQEKQKEQNHVCAICTEVESTVDNRSGNLRSLSVDHNHITGQIRGLLCRGCNQGLGNFKENLARLKKAVNYLEKYNGL